VSLVAPSRNSPGRALERTALVMLAIVCATSPELAWAQQPRATTGAAPSPTAVSANSLRALKVRISLDDRMLWVMQGSDTMYRAPVAVASNDRLSYAGRTWQFATPLGEHVVLGKRIDPVWTPPDWHYAEVAKAYALRLRHLPERGLVLPDGRHIVVRDSTVGLLVGHDSMFAALPLDEHVVFDSTLYIPPIDTRNREVRGPLGAFALDLGAGYMLHGTDDPASIGTASTHGCIRLAPRDIAWLYSHVPIGAEVVVF